MFYEYVIAKDKQFVKGNNSLKRQSGENKL
jgi:hypothetical protein